MHVMMAMTTVALIPLGGRELPLSSTGTLALGLAFALVGIWSLWRGFSSRWSGTLTWQGGAKVSRFSALLTAVCTLTWSAAVMLNGYFEVLSSRRAMHLVLASMGLICVAAAYDGITHWMRKRRQ
jgi:hypothetical protein